MSKLDELINKLCPNGVTYKTLGELGEFLSGLTGKSKDDFKEGNSKFITYVNVFNNPALNLHLGDKVRILPGEKQRKLEYGDVIFTGSSETPDECAFSSVVCEEPIEDAYLNSFCFIWRLFNKETFNVHFLKHLFRSNELRKQLIKTASGVTRFNVSKEKMTKVLIPIPPLEVQCEIVRILDNFAELTAELTAELSLRKSQEEFYKSFLLSKEGKEYKLCDIADISTGSSNTQDAEENGLYPFFVRSQDSLKKNSYEFDEESIITAGDGVGVGKVFHYINGKYALHQRAYRIHPNEKVFGKFLFYYFQTFFPDYIRKNMFEGSVPSIRRPMLNYFIVFLPNYDTQVRISGLLDYFNSYSTDIQIGLPAEIKSRKKQYEYYRDKLLAFKRLED